MPRGGARPGAGRKKEQRTIQSEKLREYLIEQVIKEKSPIIKALIKKAKGGDTGAIKEILDRALGKAKESLDLTSGGEKIYNWETYKNGKGNNISSAKVDTNIPRK